MNSAPVGASAIPKRPAADGPVRGAVVVMAVGGSAVQLPAPHAALDEALVAEPVVGRGDRGAADTEGGGQVALGGQPGAQRQPPVLDQAADGAGERGVHRPGKRDVAQQPGQLLAAHITGTHTGHFPLLALH